MKIAVIDLGTNTCNLLIAEVNSDGYRILHQSKELVRLGDGKIRSNKISSEATKRAVQSLLHHKKIIEKFQTDKIRVIATSAVRTAENRIPFLETLTEKSGYVVKVITGEKEAKLIFNGVLLAVNEFSEPAVILDIGGGSNELILACGKKMIWKESQPTGMSRIIHRFKISNPIKPEEINALQNYFTEQHLNTFQKCINEKVKTLIGCSGAFDTLCDIIDQVNPEEKMRITQEILMNEFFTVYEKLIGSTKEERIKMKGMDMVRVDLIVPAVILIEQVISRIGIQKIVQTDFALREGVLFEMIENS